MNSAIKLRTATEINGEKLGDKQRSELVKQIYEGRTMQQVLSWQGEDGFFGDRMHTPVSNGKQWSCEGCIRYLFEMGLSMKEEPLEKAMTSLRKPDWYKELNGNNSVASREFGFEIIRAALFAQAGLVEYEFVRYWTAMSLNAFRILAEAESMEEIITTYRGKKVFREGKSLPNIYHMRMLAYTDIWRSKTNLGMLGAAYEKFYAWLPLPPIYIKANTQLVAPAFTIAQPYNKDFNEQEAFYWLQFYELTVRMGMLTTKSPFYIHFLHLMEKLMENREEVLDHVEKRGFLPYTGYSGMMLEEDWRSKDRKREDILFRIQLIDALSKKYEISW